MDSVREEANSRINQLEESTKEQTRTDLQAKLHNRSGALADHSERAKQLQQVGSWIVSFLNCSQKLCRAPNRQL